MDHMLLASQRISRRYYGSDVIHLHPKPTYKYYHPHAFSRTFIDFRKSSAEACFSCQILAIAILPLHGMSDNQQVAAVLAAMEKYVNEYVQFMCCNGFEARIAVT
eukprot:scaffold199478_cov43-Prasinocladus_malaysianus.AAC.2